MAAWERQGRWLAALALIALTGVCFARLVAEPDALLVDGRRPSVDDAQRGGRRVPGNDITRVYLPQRMNLVATLKRTGRPPWWDPTGFGGRPRLGNPQAGLFYPPVWLTWWWDAPAALGWLTVAHLLWGGLGTYRLVRLSGAGRLAATVAAGCFQASPYVLAQTFEGHYPHVWAACWAPWAFGAALHLRRGNFGRALALPWILGLALLTGHPQEGYYLIIALGAWFGWDALRSWSRRSRTPARTVADEGAAEPWRRYRADRAHAGRGRSAALALVILAGAFALTVGLVAVELVPDALAQAWVLKSGRLSVSHASHYHLNPLNLLQLLTPRALGGPADYFGHDNFWESMLSMGWVPLILAALAWSRSSRRDWVVGWAALTGLAVVFAAGWRFGLFALLYEVVPGMDRFRVPARSLFLAALGGAVLAGLGVEATAEVRGDWSRFERRYRRGLLLIVGALLLGQVGAWRLDLPQSAQPTTMTGGGEETRAARKSRMNRQREGIRWTLAASRIDRDGTFWLAVLGTTAALAWGRRRPEHRRRVAIALAALALAELGAYGERLLKTASPAWFLGPDPISQALARHRPDGPFRIRVEDTLYDDLHALRNGFEKTNINDFFQIQHAADLYESLYPIFRPSASFEPHGQADRDRLARTRPEVRQAVLDRMNVALLVASPSGGVRPWPPVVSDTWGDARFTVYRNSTALPRAYVVPRARVAPDEAAAVGLFPKVDPRSAVLMTADPLGTGGTRQEFTPASYRSDDPDRVTVTVTTRAAGLLVVADTWMPGWTAVVDGRPVPVLRGNRAQRVIPLARAGRHQVVLAYHPPGLTTGLAITGAGVIAWLAVAAVVRVRVRARRRGRRRRPWCLARSPVGERSSARGVGA